MQTNDDAHHLNKCGYLKEKRKKLINK